MHNASSATVSICLVCQPKRNNCVKNKNVHIRTHPYTYLTQNKFIVFFSWLSWNLIKIIKFVPLWKLFTRCIKMFMSFSAGSERLNLYHAWKYYGLIKIGVGLVLQRRKHESMITSLKSFSTRDYRRRWRVIVQDIPCHFNCNIKLW